MDERIRKQRTPKRPYKCLTWQQRLQLEAYLKAKTPKKEIAQLLGVHISTVYREVKRGTYKHKQGWTDSYNYGERKYKVVERYSPDIAEEKYPVKVGYDLTVVPHDKNGYLDYLLNYTHRTRLGNFIMFRDFKGEVQRNPNGKAIKAGWTDYLRKNNVYSSACFDFLDGAYAAGGKEMFTACGEQELSQVV